MTAPVLIALFAVFLLFGLSCWARIVGHRQRQIAAAGGEEPAPPAPHRRTRVDAARRAAWFVVHGADVPTVAAELSLRTPIAMGRADGLAAAAEGLFVVARGPWVVAIGRDAWHEGDFAAIGAALARLAAGGRRAHWFVHDDDAGHFGWAAARGGLLVRAYCCDGDAEQVLWDEGAIDAGERDLGFFVADPRDQTDSDIKWWPAAAHVRRLAARWSVDPRDLPASAAATGLFGRW